ncbi:class I SAM-dependent methyltransferase [Methylobacterium sp. JK268]
MVLSASLAERVGDGPARAATLAELVGSDRLPRRTEAAWTRLKPTLEGLIRALPAHRVLEIGGGRHPFFSRAETERLGFALTVNDIDPAELRYAPPGMDVRVFDVARPLDAALLGETYDLVYSRMVFEHVKDAETAWRNVHALLRPGGVGFAFVPTLYSPPFLLNRLLPDGLTGRALRLLDRSRNPDEIPKFPAYYAWCRASQAVLAPRLRRLGFGEVEVVPFYGTPYFPAVPGLKRLSAAFDALAVRRDWRSVASYAYITARKAEA